MDSPSQMRSKVCWPDPNPTDPNSILADDVTGFNATPVGRIIFIRTRQDLQDALALARSTGATVSMRGTQHSMGGQSIAPNGIVLDLKYFNAVTYHRDTNTVTVEPGAMWSDVISVLNLEGYSPRTMQSYSSFSVGGTLAVNGHGITTDFCMIEAVLSFEVMMYDGSIVTCGRDAPTEVGRELFGLVIGGYGMFGIMISIHMKISPNTTVDQEAIVLNISEFPDVYKSVQEDKTIDIKLARLDITSMETATLYLFRRIHRAEMRTVSHLSIQAREMGFVQQMMYKWLAPTMKELRFGVEQATGLALDWSAAVDRNTLMFESAKPLARLTSPYLDVDDTFILQEYFVPRDKFCAWIRAVRNIYFDAAKLSHVTILNTTIRFVHYDEDCFMRYAKCTDGMFAFVLYYRVHRTAEADAKLEELHHKFVGATLRLGGTFYLPYRHHYSEAEMLTAYPQIKEFFGKKQKYDPEGLFDSLWFRAYGMKQCSDEYRQIVEGRQLAFVQKFTENTSLLWPLSTKPAKLEIPSVSERRTDSYVKLFKNIQMRRAFLQQFLTRVFSVRSEVEVGNEITKALYTLGENPHDDLVYSALYQKFSSSSPFSNIVQSWKTLGQLQAQKTELQGETTRVLHKLGRVGLIHDYVSIGDHGKLVLRLQQSLKMQGKVWIVHDSIDECDVAAAMERGSAEPLGTFVPIEYSDATFSVVPDESADLVTMNQGLHHIPLSSLKTFLMEVLRVLRKGGVFITREHNGTENMIPMLDLAHSVFNAVTGVDPATDRKEIRAFRSVQQWRDLLSDFGFIDTMVYDVQSDDPTVDFMLCFVKPPFNGLTVRGDLPTSPSKAAQSANPASKLAQQNIPKYLMENGATFIDRVSEVVQDVLKFVEEASPDPHMTKTLLAPTEKIALEMLDRLKPILAHAVSSTSSSDVSNDALLPPELYEGYLALAKRMKNKRASANEAFIYSLIESVKNALSESEAEETEAGQVTSLEAATPPPAAALIRAELEALATAIPNITSPGFWDSCGISRQLQNAAVSQGGGMEELSVWLSTKLDFAAWEEVRAAFQEVQRTKLPPHIDYVLGKKGPGNPWWKAAVAVLGCPKMKLTQSARWGASLSGYGEFIELYDAAQGARQHQDLMQRQNSDTPEGIERACDEAINTIMGTQVEVIMEGKKEMRDIHDVAKIIKIEHRGQDITAWAVEKYLNGGTLKFAHVNLDSERRYTSVTNTRLVQWMQGSAIVRVLYVSSSPNPSSSILPAVEVVLSNLTLQGYRRLRTRQPGAYTFYKLPEWMQVEMCKGFAASLDHTPWYRYPYFAVIKEYFRVLRNEFTAVRKRYGFSRAFFSSAFATSFIPGVVMGVLFLQLQTLAIPAMMKGGEDYDTATQKERCIFALANEKSPMELIPEQIFAEKFKDVPRKLRDRVWEVNLPVFQPFTECLKILSTIPSLQVIDLSNQPIIQVKLSVKISVGSIGSVTGAHVDPTTSSAEQWSDRLKRKFNAETVVQYSYPARVFPPDQDHEKVYLGVTIRTPYLMGLLRFCDKYRDSVFVEQVFDFWG